MQELPRVGAEIAGYRLESLVARGGMAVVYLAEHLRLDRKVAIKILAPELAEDDAFRKRFLGESRVAAGIDHQNIIPIYDAGEAEGLLYIAMRHVQGTDLRGLIREEAPLELDRVISLTAQIASALEAAHERNLVHRDVKPANVLLIPRRSPESQDHVYLSDFGLAKHVSSVSGLTATGQFVGTVSYVAPEQIEGHPVDARTDIYALGCVMFECLTGQPPFRKDEDLAVIMAHLREPAPMVTELRADCPPELAEVVGKALAKSPDERYQNCDELIRDLRADAVAVAPLAETVAAEPVGSAPRPIEREQAPIREPERRPNKVSGPASVVPRGFPRRAQWLLAAAVVGILAVVALLVVLGGRDRAPEVPVVGPTGAKTSARWAVVAASPTARQQVGAAVVGGRIWVVGGLTGKGTATAKVEAYDPATNAWAPGPDLPVPLHHAMAANYRGELVVMGGWVPRGPNVTAVTSSRVFALRDGDWVRLPDLRRRRAAGAAAAVGDKLVVVGGQVAGRLVKTTEVFDGTAWRDVAEMPTPREHMAAASDGQYVYAVGGRELAADRNSAALERYDPASDSWTELAAMPTPSGSLGAAIVQGHLVAVGGEDPTRVLDATQSYDLKTGAWSALPAMRTPRHGMAVGGVGTTLYALDGAQAPTHSQSTDSGESIDLAAAYPAAPRVNAWRSVHDSPTARQQVASAVAGGRLWVLGGLVGTTSTPKVEAYDPAIDTWTAGPPLPLPLHHAMAATYRNELVVMGGWLPSGANLTAVGSEQVFALRNGAWVRLPKLNRPRSAGAAVAVGNKLVVVGGQSSGKLVETTEVFDGRRWKEAAPIPTLREHLAAVSDGRYVYAIGGRRLSADRNLAVLERYDPATDRWAKLPSMPTPSGGLGAAIVKGHLVALGGEDPAKVIAAVQSFDLRTNRWSALPPMRTPRHGMAVAVFGDTLYAMDGAEAPTHSESTNQAEALDFR